VDRVIPRMKATFPLWSTVFQRAISLNIRTRRSSTLDSRSLQPKTTVVGLRQGYSTPTGNIPNRFLFSFFFTFSGLVHIPYFSFLFSCGTISCTFWRAFPFSCQLLAFPTGGPGSVIKTPFFHLCLTRFLFISTNLGPAHPCCWPPRQYLVHYLPYISAFPSVFC
jgi:hypothetical protein